MTLINHQERKFKDITNTREETKDQYQKEFKKTRPPTFDGDNKKVEDAETWILEMKKYFKVHEYSKKHEG